MLIFCTLFIISCDKEIPTPDGSAVVEEQVDQWGETKTDGEVIVEEDLNGFDLEEESKNWALATDMQEDVKEITIDGTTYRVGVEYDISEMPEHIQEFAKSKARSSGTTLIVSATWSNGSSAGAFHLDGFRSTGYTNLGGGYGTGGNILYQLDWANLRNFQGTGGNPGIHHYRFVNNDVSSASAAVGLLRIKNGNAYWIDTDQFSFTHACQTRHFSSWNETEADRTSLYETGVHIRQERNFCHR